MISKRERSGIIYLEEVYEDFYLKTLKEKTFKGEENDPKTGFGMIFIKKHHLGLQLMK